MELTRKQSIHSQRGQFRSALLLSDSTTTTNDQNSASLSDRLFADRYLGCHGLNSPSDALGLILVDRLVPRPARPRSSSVSSAPHTRTPPRRQVRPPGNLCPSDTARSSGPERCPPVPGRAARGLGRGLPRDSGVPGQSWQWRASLGPGRHHLRQVSSFCAFREQRQPAVLPVIF